MDEFLTSCRLCLWKGDKMHQIFGSGNNDDIAVKIRRFLPLDVRWNDSLPTRICTNCLFKLETFSEFYYSAVRIDARLRKNLGLRKIKYINRRKIGLRNAQKGRRSPILHRQSRCSSKKVETQNVAVGTEDLDSMEVSLVDSSCSTVIGSPQSSHPSHTSSEALPLTSVPRMGNSSTAASTLLRTPVGTLSDASNVELPTTAHADTTQTIGGNEDTASVTTQPALHATNEDKCNGQIDSPSIYSLAALNTLNEAVDSSSKMVQLLGGHNLNSLQLQSVMMEQNKGKPEEELGNSVIIAGILEVGIERNCVSLQMNPGIYLVSQQKTNESCGTVTPSNNVTETEKTPSETETICSPQRHRGNNVQVSSLVEEIDDEIVVVGEYTCASKSDRTSTVQMCSPSEASPKPEEENEQNPDPDNQSQQQEGREKEQQQNTQSNHQQLQKTDEEMEGLERPYETSLEPEVERQQNHISDSDDEIEMVFVGPSLNEVKRHQEQQQQHNCRWDEQEQEQEQGQLHGVPLSQLRHSAEEELHQSKELPTTGRNGEGIRDSDATQSKETPDNLEVSTTSSSTTGLSSDRMVDLNLSLMMSTKQPIVTSTSTTVLPCTQYKQAPQAFRDTEEQLEPSLSSHTALVKSATQLREAEKISEDVLRDVSTRQHSTSNLVTTDIPDSLLNEHQLIKGQLCQRINSKPLTLEDFKALLTARQDPERDKQDSKAAETVACSTVTERQIVAPAAAGLHPENQHLQVVFADVHVPSAPQEAQEAPGEATPASPLPSTTGSLLPQQPRKRHLQTKKNCGKVRLQEYEQLGEVPETLSMENEEDTSTEKQMEDSESNGDQHIHSNKNLTLISPDNGSVGGKEKNKGGEWCSVQPKSNNGVRVVLRRISSRCSDVLSPITPPIVQTDPATTLPSRTLLVFSPQTSPDSTPTLCTTHSVTAPPLIPATDTSPGLTSTSTNSLPPLSNPMDTISSPNNPPASSPTSLPEQSLSSSTLSVNSNSALSNFSSSVQISKSFVLPPFSPPPAQKNGQSPPFDVSSSSAILASVAPFTTQSSGTCTNLPTLPSSLCNADILSSIIPLPPLSPSLTASIQTSSVSSVNSSPVLPCKAPLQSNSLPSSPQISKTGPINGSTPNCSSQHQSYLYTPPKDSSQQGIFYSPPPSICRGFTPPNSTSPVHSTLPISRPSSPPTSTHTSSLYQECTPPRISDNMSPPVLSPNNQNFVPQKYSVFVSSPTPPKLLPAVASQSSDNTSNVPTLPQPLSVLSLNSSTVKTSIAAPENALSEDSCQKSSSNDNSLKTRRNVYSKTIYNNSNCSSKQQQRRRTYWRKKTQY